MAGEVISNLKVRIGADASNFKKEMNSADQGLQQFTSQAGGAFDSFASVFGVNLSSLRQSLDGFKTAMGGLGKAAAGSAAGSGLLTRALGVLKVAMIGTGIGALVVALGSLVVWFKRTEVGGDALARIMAGVGAAFNVIMDRIAGFGQTIVNAFKNPIQAAKDFWKFLTGGGIQNSVKSFANEIASETKQAVANANALDELEDKENALIEVQAKRRLEIAKLRSEAVLDGKSEKEKADLLRRAIDLENKTMQENLDLQRTRVQVAQSQYDMGQKTAEDTRKLAEEKAKLYDLETEYYNATRKMTKQAEGFDAKADKAAQAKNAYDELNKKIQELTQTQQDFAVQGKDISGIVAQIDALEVQKQKIDELIAHQGILNKLQSSTGVIEATKNVTVKPAEALTTGQVAQLKDNGKITAPGLDLSTYNNALEAARTKMEEEMERMKEVTQSIAQAIKGTMENMAAGFGESIGNMMIGVGKFSDIGKTILSSLGDLAIQIGKIAIAEGITMLAIKKSFNNPTTAIAAGIALVALGTAVKGAMNNALSGGNSSGLNSNSGGSTYDSRSSSVFMPKRADTLTVKVVGETRMRNKDIYVAWREGEKSTTRET